MSTEPAHIVGTIVLHPNRSEWGPGKVVRVDDQAVHVVFRDDRSREARRILRTVISLTVAPEQHDDVLDHLPPLKEEGEKLVLPAERLSFAQAIEEFVRRYPQGFEDKDYLARERDYKWRAHETWQKNLGGGRLERLVDTDVAEAARLVLQCVGQVNLLYPVEAAAFRDALQDSEAAESYLRALRDLLASPVEESSATTYFQTVSGLPAERARVASWPVATVLPFLAQPDRHMFLKPAVTQTAADRLGCNLNYKPSPNWVTYASLLGLAERCRERIAHMKPRDLIDVSSFLYVTCGGYERLGV